MAEPYPFTEWTNNILDLRYQELVNIIPIKHGTERQQDIGREMSHLVFEMGFRQYIPTTTVGQSRGTWNFPSGLKSAKS